MKHNIEFSCAAESPTRSQPQPRHSYHQKTTYGDCSNDLLCITISRDAILISPSSGAAHGLLASSFSQRYQTILARPSFASQLFSEMFSKPTHGRSCYSVPETPRRPTRFSSCTTWHKRFPVCHGDHHSGRSGVHVVQDNDVERSSIQSLAICMPNRLQQRS
jgi:hypothetical protein